MRLPGLIPRERVLRTLPCRGGVDVRTELDDLALVRRRRSRASSGTSPPVASSLPEIVSSTIASCPNAISWITGLDPAKPFTDLRGRRKNSLTACLPQTTSSEPRGGDITIMCGSSGQSAAALSASATAVAVPAVTTTPKG